MKKIILICFSILCSLFSQAEVLEFKQKKFDFGEIKEKDGKVKHIFEYTNTNDKPVVILGVRSSCGCTIPSYSREPIKPNKTGQLEVTFNPHRRPGNFHKTITVNTNLGKEVLAITGKVIPKPKSIQDEFPIYKSGLRFKDDNLHFGLVIHNDVKTEYFSIYNDSKEDLKINFIKVPKHITINYPKVLKPKKTELIEISYSAKEKKDWGFVLDNLLFTVNKEKNSIGITANIVDNVPSTINAAKLMVDRRFVNLGKQKVGTKLSQTIKIKNKGESNLYLRKIKAFDKFLTYNLQKDFLKPGEEANLEVNITVPDARRSVYSKLQIVSNDPTSWTTTIRFAVRIAK